MRAQARGLRIAGLNVEVLCRRGRFKYLLSTGSLPKRASAAAMELLGASARCVTVDHGMYVTSADIVFVHNLLRDAAHYLRYKDWTAQVSAEERYFTGLNQGALIIANSDLVRNALIREYSLAPSRIRVLHPGFRSTRFNRTTAQSLRLHARRSLRLPDSTPLVGFVTSGDFQKRGLDIFLESADRIAVAVPAARFLVVGSKRLPPRAASHPLVRTGRVLYRPKSMRPDPWFAALDVFLYPARYEEFGLVVSEALAMGLPVLASRRVGATECFPPAYVPWILDAPDAARFAELTLALLEAPAQRAQLGAAGAEAVAAFDDQRYVRETVALILERARAKAEAAPAAH